MLYKLEITNQKGYDVKHFYIQLLHRWLLRHKYICKYVGIFICLFLLLGLYVSSTPGPLYLHYHYTSIVFQSFLQIFTKKSLSYSKMYSIIIYIVQ